MLAEIGAVLHQPFSEMERRRWSDFAAFYDEACRIDAARHRIEDQRYGRRR